MKVRLPKGYNYQGEGLLHIRPPHLVYSYQNNEVFKKTLKKSYKTDLLANFSSINKLMIFLVK